MPIEPSPFPTAADAGVRMPSEAPVAQPNTLDLADFHRIIASDVLDKQYRLYTWNDFKTQALITTNSILFAAVGFLYKECVKDTLAIVLLFTAIGLLAWSLVTCLRQVIPRISSGKSGNEPNLRSLRGISMYRSWEDYLAAFRGTMPADVLTDTIRQVYGMVNNNLRSAKIIKHGVLLTSVAVGFIVGAIVAASIAATGVSLFGKWQTEPNSPTIQVPAINTTPDSAIHPKPVSFTISVPEAPENKAP